MNYITVAYLLGSAILLMWGAVHTVRCWYLERMTRAYLEGFRDGQMAEARANQVSAPKIAVVKVPLTGRN